MSRAVALALVALVALPREAAACAWLGNPFAPCLVRDIKERDYLLAGTWLTGAKAVAFTMRIRDVKHHMDNYRVTADSAMAFKRRLTGMLGAPVEQVDLLPSFIAEFNRQRSGLVYALNAETGRYGLLTLAQLVDTVRTSLRTKAGFEKSLGFTPGLAGMARRGDWAGTYGAIAEATQRTVAMQASVDQSANDIRGYARQLDSLVGNRTDTEGTSEARMGRLAAALNQSRTDRARITHQAATMRLEALMGMQKLRRETSVHNGSKTARAIMGAM